MDLKLLEDLVALDEERSFVRAAERRNVTHPAFGRRIRSLEGWAGTALVDREHVPVRLNVAGQALAAQARTMLQELAQTRQQLRTRHQPGSPVLRLATGRTLARTLVADWLVQMARPRKPLHGMRVEVCTASMSDVGLMLERGEVDLVCCYEHPAMSLKLGNLRFRYITLANDRLVPVSRVNARGQALHDLVTGPLIAYDAALSLGALLATHSQRHIPDAESRTRYVCDSADAIQEYAIKGLGVAWLPWSMVAADCKRGTLVALGKRSDEVHFEVRLYRRAASLPPEIEAAWRATDH